MFDRLERLPDDPILGLIKLYREDNATRKVDLGAGVYQTEAGLTPVLSAVKTAERRLLESQRTKTYEGLAGNLKFNAAMTRLLYGADHPALRDRRIATVQTTGGSGGLHVAAGVILRTNRQARIWTSEPTWPNHQPLLSSVGAVLEPYPYYDAATQSIDFNAMLSTLDKAPAGDVVLLHGCCHNPTGADLTRPQWDELVELLQRRQLVPFIDVAYQGFAEGVEEDVYGVRLCAAKLPEMLVVSSCSKNFGLYRDRVGAASIVAANPAEAAISASHLANVTRRVYSMPPAHGAEVVQDILNDPVLRKDWLRELGEMRHRINELRSKLAGRLEQETGTDRFSFIARQRGMFSMLGLSPQQITRLRDEFHVYMVGSSRANIAGVSDANLDYLCSAIAAVIRG